MYITFSAKGPLGDARQDARVYYSLIHAAVKAGQLLHKILHPRSVKILYLCRILRTQEPCQDVY